MIDKLKYNNLIISGSKEIQKAKVQVVRKLIQKMQKLKKLIELHPNDESCKIKLRKCLEIVENVKKMKRFDALTNSLLLKKCPKKVLTNSSSKADEAAVAMLALNPTMKTLLTKIRQELNLNDADLSTWRKSLIQISKQKIRTLRKKKRKMALEAGTSSKNTTKLKKKTENDKSLSKNEKQITSKSLATNAKEEPTEDNCTIKTVEDEAQVPKMKLKTQKSGDQKIKLESPVSKASAHISLNKKESKKNQKSKPENAFTANETKASVSFKSLNSELKNNSKLMPKPTTIQAEVKVVKVVDDFFVTSTGENYVAIAPVIETNNKVTENKLSSKAPKKESNRKSELSKSENEKMHPSWAAKQKRNTPVSFQGKRKVFEDANDKAHNKHNLVNSDQKDSATSALHPSWAAKQKLKPTITAFQGKKIKFEDA